MAFFQINYKNFFCTCRPLQSQLERSSESDLKVIPTSEANFVFVDSKQILESMIEHLRGETLIAVDLEAHWYRSYQGFTCLIQVRDKKKYGDIVLFLTILPLSLQISSSDTDYVIDPFPLWRDLTCLNEIFTDPKVPLLI